jgi:hypothetical protein
VTSAVNQVLHPHPDDLEDEPALQATLLALRVKRAAFRADADA